MRIRKKPLGDKNLVGARIESIRRNRGMKQKELLAQLQVRGVDINASALSKLEGQLRTVTDIELLAFAEILDVDVFWLLTNSKPKPGKHRTAAHPVFLLRIFIAYSLIPCTQNMLYAKIPGEHAAFREFHLATIKNYSKQFALANYFLLFSPLCTAHMV